MIEIPMFPLSGVFVPGDPVSLRVFEPRYVSMCKDILAGDSMSFATVMITAGSEVGGNDRRGEWGTFVQIRDMYVTEEGGYMLLGVAGERCKIMQWLPDDPYPKALVEQRQTSEIQMNVFGVLCDRLTMSAQRVRSLIQQLADMRDMQMEPLPGLTKVAAGQWAPDHADVRAWDHAFWEVVRHTPCGPQDRYALLCLDEADKRLDILDRILDHVAEVIAFHGSSPPSD